MISLEQVEGFDWDEGNVLKSLLKHGIPPRDAEQIFFNDPLLLLEDPRHSEAERRLHALGRSNAGRLLHISFTLREEGKLIRIISARPMSRKEQSRYAQEA